MDTVSKDAIELIDNIKDMDPNIRLDKLKNLSNVLTETLKRGEEKVALAKSTYDAVSMVPCNEGAVCIHHGHRLIATAIAWTLTWSSLRRIRQWAIVELQPCLACNRQHAV